MMTNVLGRKEDSKGESIQKVAAGQQPRDGTHRKVGSLVQKFTNVTLLWDRFPTVPTMLFEQRHGVLHSWSKVTRLEPK
jgi:hypothetical protein